MVEKSNYLTVNRCDIAFAISIVSQFLSAPKISHWNVAIYILRYLKKAPRKMIIAFRLCHTRVAGFSDADCAGSPIDRRSVTDYYVFVKKNLVSWRSKKQSVISQSSVELEYHAMTDLTCDLI